MKQVIPVIVGLLLLGLLSGCSAGKHIDEAKLTVQKYYVAIRNDSIDDALVLFSPGVFEETPKETLRKMIEGTLTRTGDLVNYDLVNWSLNFGGGTYCTLVYNSKYAEHEAQEIFVLTNDGPNGQWQIVSWNISSAAFIPMDT